MVQTRVDEHHRARPAAMSQLVKASTRKREMHERQLHHARKVVARAETPWSRLTIMSICCSPSPPTLARRLRSSTKDVGQAKDLRGRPTDSGWPHTANRCDITTVELHRVRPAGTLMDQIFASGQRFACSTFDGRVESGRVHVQRPQPA
jgi:hypothetical protein